MEVICADMQKLDKIDETIIKQYVLVTKFSDADIYDPWYVGFVTEYGIDYIGKFVRVEDNVRKWRNIKVITSEEGAKILSDFR